MSNSTSNSTNTEPRDPYEPPEASGEDGGGEGSPNGPGEIEMESRVGRVIFQFEDPVRAVAMSPEEAKDFAGSLLNLSRQAKKQKKKQARNTNQSS